MSAGGRVSDHHYLRSSYREKTLEHIFVGECLKALWRRGVYDAEVLRSEVDGAGYDLILEHAGIARHIQLKASHTNARTARQTLNGILSRKLSGCAVWIIFNDTTLELGPFYWFGNSPGKPLPNLTNYPRAKRTTANSKGVKPERLNSYSVPKAYFRKLATIDDVVTELFGPISTS